MSKEYRVNVYAGHDDSTIVGRVRYNADLDYWDGRNYTNGGTGRHKGIAKLKSGEYVIIHGTQWQGERDTAFIVSADEALQEIMKSGNTELLNTKKFKELKEMYKKFEDCEDLEEE